MRFAVMMAFCCALVWAVPVVAANGSSPVPDCVDMYKGYHIQKYKQGLDSRFYILDPDFNRTALVTLEASCPIPMGMINVPRTKLCAGETLKIRGDDCHILSVHLCKVQPAMCRTKK